MQEYHEMDATRKPANQGLRGKRYIAYARCATEEGSATRLQEQARIIRQFGDSLDMQCVDEVRLAGVGGCLPVMRPDLCQLLARKRERGDYDVLIMEDVARLTRMWPEGCQEIETKFRNCGVQIVYLSEAMRIGEMGGQVSAPGTPCDDGRNAL